MHLAVCYLGPIYKHELNSIPAWISKYIPYKVKDDITYPFPNFNGATVNSSHISLGTWLFIINIIIMWINTKV